MGIAQVGILSMGKVEDWLANGLVLGWWDVDKNGGERLERGKKVGWLAWFFLFGFLEGLTLGIARRRDGFLRTREGRPGGGVLERMGTRRQNEAGRRDFKIWTPARGNGLPVGVRFWLATFK